MMAILLGMREYILLLKDASCLGMKTVGNGRKTSQPFSTSTFEYENESESGKAGHKNEHEH